MFWLGYLIRTLSELGLECGRIILLRESPQQVWTLSVAWSKAGRLFGDQDFDQLTEKAGCKPQEHWDRGQKVNGRQKMDSKKGVSNSQGLGGRGAVAVIMVRGMTQSLRELDVEPLILTGE